MDQVLKEEGEFPMHGKAGTHTGTDTEDGKKVVSSPHQRNRFGAGNGVNGAYGS